MVFSCIPFKLTLKKYIYIGYLSQTEGLNSSRVALLCNSQSCVPQMTILGICPLCDVIQSQEQMKPAEA